MSLIINSHYDFAIVKSGSRFPEVLAHSRNGTDLSGFYALRELGLEDFGDHRNSYSVLFSALRPKPDFTTETWVVDAWTSESDVQQRDGRKKNIALVVKGLPDPRRAGHRGEAIFSALQRHLALLADIIPSGDERAIEFNVIVLSALLGRVDQLRSHLEGRRAMIRLAMLSYGIVGFIAAASVAILKILDRWPSAS